MKLWETLLSWLESMEYRDYDGNLIPAPVQPVKEVNPLPYRGEFPYIVAEAEDGRILKYTLKSEQFLGSVWEPPWQEEWVEWEEWDEEAHHQTKVEPTIAGYNRVRYGDGYKALLVKQGNKKTLYLYTVEDEFYTIAREPKTWNC